MKPTTESIRTQKRVDTTAVTIRMDRKMHEALRQAAAREGLSLNLWIVLAIQTRLERP